MKYYSVKVKYVRNVVDITIDIQGWIGVMLYLGRKYV